ncbi:hypothetical protein SNA20_06805, partial [Escherichia coli]|nr:hypothetical protein [Escherichia coli]
IREILISESAWEEMTCLFAPSLGKQIAYPVCLSFLDMFNDVTQPFFWSHIVQTACTNPQVQHRRILK